MKKQKKKKRAHKLSEPIIKSDEKPPSPPRDQQEAPPETASLSQLANEEDGREKMARDLQRFASTQLTTVASDADEIPNPDEIDLNQKIARTYIQKKNAEDKAAAMQNQRSPIPAEPESPTPSESSPKATDQQGKVLKEEGPRFPMSSLRPQPPSASKEEGSVIVAKALSEQLGTSPELKAEQRIDERKMAVLTDGTLAALSHFSYRHVYDGVRYWGHITEWWLTGSQGIGGLGRRHILQALANTSGIQVMDKAEKPNAIARNIWDRNWKKKAEDEGKVVD